MHTSQIGSKPDKRGAGSKNESWYPGPRAAASHPSDLPASPPPVFTVEESAVIRAFASGKSDKQVCAELRMPLQSFYRLMRDLKEKTGACDRIALIVWAVRHGPSRDKRESDRDYKWRRPA